MEFKSAVKNLSDAHFSVILANFQIGKLINDTAVHNKIPHDEVIKGLVQNGLSASHLYTCYRVFHKFKTETFLRRLKASFEGILTWGFIINNIIEAPEGDSQEAVIYWEDKLRSIEKTFSIIEHNILKNYSALPENIKSQVEGLLINLGYELPSLAYAKDEIKIAHISDIHISEKLTTSGRLVINPVTGKNKRLEDIQRCLSFAVTKAIENSCDIALISEPFDRYNPTPNEIEVFMQEILRLSAHMPVIIEPGNHGLDKNRLNASAFVFLKGQPNIFVAEEPTSFYYYRGTVSTKLPTNINSSEICLIHVLPYPIRYGNDSNSDQVLKEHIKKFKKMTSKESASILLAHITIEGAENTYFLKHVSKEPVLTIKDIEGFDYVALGHIHTYQQVSDRAYYAGNIERLDFDEENQPKGFIIATLNLKTKDLKVDFIETPATKMKTLSVEDLKKVVQNGNILPDTLYRVVGFIDSTQREIFKDAVRKFQEKAPLLIKVQIASSEKQAQLAQKISDQIKEEDALLEFLKAKNVEQEIIHELLEEHKNIKESALSF